MDGNGVIRTLPISQPNPGTEQIFDIAANGAAAFLSLMKRHDLVYGATYLVGAHT